MADENPIHICNKETEIALIQQSLERIEKNNDEMLDLLKGTNGEGLITKIALHSQSLKRVWWWLGGISTAIMVSAFFVIRSALA